MIKKIFQISDVHIRNNERHEEYFEQIEKTCESIQKEIDSSGLSKDEVRILLCGDIVHSKNTITNELILFTASFLRQISSIAKTIVYCGNHDFVMSNTEKMGTLTAIFNTADFKENPLFIDEQLDYKSGCLKDENITWALYSIYDNYLKPNITNAKLENPDNKVIGLFHGMILGAVTPNGMVADSGSDGGIFDGCDAVMAGHIHKYQVLEREGVKIVYGGSLIQQDYGETVSKHGYVSWDVDSMKEKFTEIPSDYGFYKIEANSIDDFDEDIAQISNM